MGLFDVDADSRFDLKVIDVRPQRGVVGVRLDGFVPHMMHDRGTPGGERQTDDQRKSEKSHGTSLRITVVRSVR